MPLGIGSSFIISPDVVVMGLDRGRTSSVSASRLRWYTAGFSLKDSCQKGMKRKLFDHETLIGEITYFKHGCQVWHGFKIVRRETFVASFSDNSFSDTYLLTEFVLYIWLFAQFQECPAKSSRSRFVSCQGNGSDWLMSRRIGVTTMARTAFGQAFPSR